MAKHRIVWGELGLLVALIVLGVLHYRNVETIELSYRIVLVVALFYVFHLVSPTRIILGERNFRYDLLIILSFVLLAGKAAFPFLDVLTTSSTLVGGALLLLIASFSMNATEKVASPSMLSGFRLAKAEPARRATITFLAALLFFVVVFEPMVRVLLSLSEVPFLRPALTAVVLIAVLQEQRAINLKLFHRIGTRLESFGKQFTALFFSSKMFLLGVTGLLVAHFAVQIGYSLPAVLTFREGPVVFSISFFSALGTLFLYLLPLYIWFTIFKVRRNHKHLPDWPVSATSLVLACVAAALVYPLVKMTPMLTTPGAFLLEKISVNDPMLALGFVAIAFIICMIIGLLDDYTRRVLMLGPFLAAVVFLGMYVYQSFVSSFLFAASEILASLNGFTIAAIPVIVVLFGVEMVFLVIGYLSFLYEIWRE